MSTGGNVTHSTLRLTPAFPARYQWFGEAFDQAIQMGLPAIQTQHPGLYFEQAALHGRRRRQAAQALPLVSGPGRGEVAETEGRE